MGRMSTTAPRLLQVRRSTRITPRMVRVTLAGDELAGFGGEGPDRRIKMFFPVEGQDRPAVPRATSGGPLWPAGEPRPTIRTYTVRRFDAAAGELDVDFVLHEGHGPAAAWARDARPGAWVGVSEPGGRYVVDPEAEFHLVIGDESALPAVATVLEALPGGVPAARLPGGRGRRRGAGTTRCGDGVAGCTAARDRPVNRWRTPSARRSFPTAGGRRGWPASRPVSATCAGTCSTTASWTAARCTRRATGAPAEPALERRRPGAFAPGLLSPRRPSADRARRRRGAVGRGRRQVGAGLLGRGPGVGVDARRRLIG